MIEEAAAVLRGGGLVAFPTETVYGLGAEATNSQAVARIFEAKGRPSSNPLIVHGADVESIRMAVSGWPFVADQLAERFWPGPLTLVLPRSGIIPDLVTGGKDTVGIRIPDSEVALSLFRTAGMIVAAPSANRSTRVSPTRAEHVQKDLGGRVAMILDSGPTSIGIESTVLDLTTDPPRILRPGAITRTQIGKVLGIEIPSHTLSSDQSEGIASSPGQMKVHYAPRTDMAIFNSKRMVKESWPSDKSIGLIVVGQNFDAEIGEPTLRVDWHEPTQASRDLYQILHAWDDGHLDLIYVVMPPESDEWLAVRDRLWRATRHWAKGEELA